MTRELSKTVICGRAGSTPSTGFTVHDRLDHNSTFYDSASSLRDARSQAQSYSRHSSRSSKNNWPIPSTAARDG